MSLDTYANLKTAIRDHAHRNDLSDNLIDDFIDMAESEMNQKLTIRDLETRATNTASTRFLALPTGFLKMRRLSIISGGVTYEVTFRSPESMPITSQSGRPRYFTVTSQLEFDRVPDASYTIEMSYWKTQTALSSSNTSNQILSRFPQVYLYGALAYLFDWARDEQRASYYKALFMDHIQNANKMDKKGRYGASPRVHVEGTTP